MNIDRFYKMIVREEDDRKYPYLDSKNIWTIAIGFTSIDGVRVSQFTPPLSDYTKLKTFYEHAFKSINRAMKFVKNFGQLSDIRQEVLMGMAYQMGDGIFEFKKTKIFIENDDWLNASIEMLDSVWFREDSPSRALRMSELFKIG
jgi:GH24 family phage-related lysozyme (muramidase)